MDQPELLRHTIRSLDDLKVPYMLVGSFASTTYGEPRFTQDIDIVIDANDGEIERLCEAFRGRAEGDGDIIAHYRKIR